MIEYLIFNNIMHFLLNYFMKNLDLGKYRYLSSATTINNSYHLPLNIECHEHRVGNFIFSCIRKLKNYDKETSILIFILKSKFISNNDLISLNSSIHPLFSHLHSMLTKLQNHIILFFNL